jgi:hypothetical protein
MKTSIEAKGIFPNQSGQQQASIIYKKGRSISTSFVVVQASVCGRKFIGCLSFGFT